MTEPLNPVVVPRKACLQSFGRVVCEKDIRCVGCLRDGTRAVLDQAQEVEEYAPNRWWPPIKGGGVDR